jgi:hypothetical protein
LASVPENVSLLTDTIWFPYKFKIFRLDISLQKEH